MTVVDSVKDDSTLTELYPKRKGGIQSGYSHSQTVREVDKLEKLELEELEKLRSKRS